MVIIVHIHLSLIRDPLQPNCAHIMLQHEIIPIATANVAQLRAKYTAASLIPAAMRLYKCMHAIRELSQ